MYAQAHYRYFKARILGFSERFDAVREQRFDSPAFRTALLVDYRAAQ